MKHEFLQHFASKVSRSASVPLGLQGGCGGRAGRLDEKSAASGTDESCVDPGIKSMVSKLVSDSERKI